MENDLSEKRSTQLIIAIAKLLNGVPISQALCVLNETSFFLKDCHTVDADHPRFKRKINEHLDGTKRFMVGGSYASESAE